MVTTISNAKLIENHHAVDGKTLHDELSIKIRKVFATELSDQEIKNAIDICSIGKSYTIEVPISGDIFNEEHLCYYSYVLKQKTKRNQMKQKKIKKVIEYFDPIFKKSFKLKIEKNNKEIKIELPNEKNFFRGVSFSENVSLKKLANGNWIKTLHAKFGEGAEEMFGMNEINEESELESRDVRIIAFIEKSLA